MADIRQQYLQDHAALVARQQTMAQAPSMLSNVGNGIMSLFGGTSPYAVTPAAPAPLAGPDLAAASASSPVITTHNVSDDASPEPQPSKSSASMHDVQANPMTSVPTLGPYIPPDHAAALNDQTMPVSLSSGGRGVTPTASERTGGIPALLSATGSQLANDAQAIGGASGGRAGMPAPTTTIGQGFSDAATPIGNAISGGYHWLTTPHGPIQTGPMPAPASLGGPGGGTQTGGSTGGPGGGTQTGQSIFGPGGALPAPMPAPTTTAATVDPQQQALADIMQQKALINSIYPERPVDNSAQDKADAELEKDRSRSSSEAMLALMAGIAQGSGGIWTGVGRGLAGAGQAYEDGFNRYQKALQNKADRVKSNNDTAYNDQVGRTDAAVKLYAQQQSLTKDNNSLIRQQFKDKQDDIDKYFTEKLHSQKGTDLNPQDDAAIAQTMRLWQLSKHNNSIINSEDDLTK